MLDKQLFNPEKNKFQSTNLNALLFGIDTLAFPSAIPLFRVVCWLGQLSYLCVIFFLLQDFELLVTEVENSFLQLQMTENGVDDFRLIITTVGYDFVI